MCFEAGGANPFAVADEPDIDPVEVEEVVEPKKVAKKAPIPKAKDPELDAIVDGWDD